MSVIVAIDGPAGSGKSSVSKAVSRELGFGYLDTGAAYRCLAWAGVDAGIDLDDARAVADQVPDVLHSRPLDPDDQTHIVRGADISDAIRGQDVSSIVSVVAKHPGVRDALNEGFRRLAQTTQWPGLVIEGRDITTVVAPDAAVRVLLTADEATRIARRQAEITGIAAETIVARDQADSTVVDFMTAADGVVTIDTTELTFQHSVQAVLDLIADTVGREDQAR